MNKSENEYIVRLATDAVMQLARDFIRNPHYFENERTLQSELRSRLSTIYTLIGLGDVASNKDGLEYKNSRVMCEPTVKKYKPDVVVFSDLDDPNKPPDDSGHWPITWACEIKYNSNKRSDIKKLREYIDQRLSGYGCFLAFNHNEETKEPKILYDEQPGSRLSVCIVNAPYTHGTSPIQL
jgi:hypothetical protein